MFIYRTLVALLFATFYILLPTNVIYPAYIVFQSIVQHFFGCKPSNSPLSIRHNTCCVRSPPIP
ncbi:hypothetical protein DERP_003628 [Dermatophagoides pteronyssinus]|uniref:Uncharacterized protein n=1 Tax=Dermatophagoides pteronyssinus TaxID=6956 RepID=A0ABQ8JL67_DERPT|nr:hypothetical protein DERP_003628 [Dermatophagoides pteronyssinus]